MIINNKKFFITLISVFLGFGMYFVYATSMTVYETFVETSITKSKLLGVYKKQILTAYTVITRIVTDNFILINKATDNKARLGIFDQIENGATKGNVKKNPRADRVETLYNTPCPSCGYPNADVPNGKEYRDTTTNTRKKELGYKYRKKYGNLITCNLKNGSSTVYTLCTENWGYQPDTTPPTLVVTACNNLSYCSWDYNYDNPKCCDNSKKNCGGMQNYVDTTCQGSIDPGGHPDCKETTKNNNPLATKSCFLPGPTK